jgi:hypothetical protein
MTALPPDLRCNCCEHGDDDENPLLQAWVGRDGFWICRQCVAHWLRSAWPDVYRRRAAE